MSDWLHTDGEHYDRLGLLLIRFGTMFVGIWMGVAVTSLFSIPTAPKRSPNF